MATIQDIARISGYSIGTVSRVINNRADVSDETRKIIEEVIKAQNYQPNSSARMLRQSVSSDISVIVRGNKVIVPGGSDHIEADDHVVVITKRLGVVSLEDILK